MTALALSQAIKTLNSIMKKVKTIFSARQSTINNNDFYSQSSGCINLSTSRTMHGFKLKAIVLPHFPLYLNKFLLFI